MQAEALFYQALLFLISQITKNLKPKSSNILHFPTTTSWIHERDYEGAYNGVEESGFANVRESDDACLQAHAYLGRRRRGKRLGKGMEEQRLWRTEDWRFCEERRLEREGQSWKESVACCSRHSPLSLLLQYAERNEGQSLLRPLLYLCWELLQFHSMEATRSFS